MTKKKTVKFLINDDIKKQDKSWRAKLEKKKKKIWERRIHYE